MKRKPIASFTKMGDIYVPNCASSQELYPLNADPMSWSSCEDAYEYTWTLDKGKDLAAITPTDTLKLSRSMGFCPHNRCQLANLTSTGSDGKCPENLCYTKLENGARSFGACCFIDGAFNSGQLIGYYNKTQHTPKPIYKNSRIVLGDVTGGNDESYGSFVNANEIHDKLIVTQCPLDITVLDVQRMLVEQNVTLWIQLAPFVDQSKDSKHVSQCTMTPDVFVNVSQRMIYSGDQNKSNFIVDVSMEASNSIHFSSPSFVANTLSIQYRSPAQRLQQERQRQGQYTMSTHGRSDALDLQNAESISDALSSSVQTHEVLNLWYNNWKDFAVPPEPDEKDIITMVEKAVNVMSQGGTVVVSCLSGRGRSGTLSALILGRLKRVTTHSQLVDIVVGMRERRDGMLETPQQFRFVSKLLQLPDTAACGVLCVASQSLHGTSETHRLLFALLAGGLLVLVPVLFMLRKTRI